MDAAVNGETQWTQGLVSIGGDLSSRKTKLNSRRTVDKKIIIKFCQFKKISTIYSIQGDLAHKEVGMNGWGWEHSINYVGGWGDLWLPMQWVGQQSR